MRFNPGEFIGGFMPAKKILIIDDEMPIRESLKLILDEQYPLIMTDDGFQGLDCLAHDKNIGLVLLDIKMPQVNGLNVLDEIKAKFPDLPVVMVTGYKSMEAVGEASRLGAKGYILKPFRSDEILEIVVKAIQK